MNRCRFVVCTFSWWLSASSAVAAVPVVSTTPGAASSATSATLNALVDPNGLATTARFEFGLTTGYGAQTASVAIGSGSGALAFAVPLTGLLPATLYHARVVATNSSGTSTGGDIAFQTLSNALTVAAWYQMGEHDPDFASGNAYTTVDGVTGNLLTFGNGNAAPYSSTIAPGAATETGSTRSINIFSYIINADGPLASTATDNLGIEGWLRIGTDAPSALL